MAMKGSWGFGGKAAGRGSWVRWLGVLVIFAAPASSADPGLLARLEGESPDLAARLAHDGLAVLGEGDPLASRHAEGFVEALVLFEQPPDRVFALLADTSRQAEFRPDLERIETVARLTDGSIEEHRVGVAFFGEIAYRLRYRTDPQARRIVWTLDPDHPSDLSRVDGFWELLDSGDGRTLARFGTRVEVGPAIPDFIADLATRRDVPRTLERCRAWVAQNGIQVAALAD